MPDPAADDGSASSVLRIGTGVGDLARLYPWLDASATAMEVPATVLQGMHVALEEAVMNVAMHAYPSGAAGQIAIRLRMSRDDATLMIEDSGPAFDPTIAVVAERPKTLHDARPGGLGLTLLRHYCRDVTYERVDDRNRLSLRFPIDRP